MSENSFGKTGVDLALHDIVAKALNAHLTKGKKPILVGKKPYEKAYFRPPL